VLSFEDHADAPGCQVAAEPAGHLRREPLLRLRAPGEVPDRPGQRRQPGQARAGKVTDVGHPAERQQMVLTQGAEPDMGRHDQLVVALVIGERGRLERRRREQLGVSAAHPGWRCGEPPVRAVNPQGVEQLGRGRVELGIVISAVSTSDGREREDHVARAVLGEHRAQGVLGDVVVAPVLQPRAVDHLERLYARQVPHRPAVLAAKILSTIDVLSGGRLTLGIGAGWMREEFEAIDAPDFDARGTVTDEYLRAFVELWTKDVPKFDGKHVRFSNIGFQPKPVQKPYPPIWVGGESGPALRRAARIGDAWYPIGTNPQNPLDSLMRFKAQAARLGKMVTEVGRDPKAVGLSLRVSVFGETAPPQAGDGEHRLFAGPPALVAADIRALRDMGVGSLDFGFGGSTAGEVLAGMQKFRAEVLPLV